MAASSNKRMRDLLTDEDISRVLDTEDESDLFSEESDDFCLIQVRKIRREIRIQVVLCMKVYGMKKSQSFRCA